MLIWPLGKVLKKALIYDYANNIYISFESLRVFHIFQNCVTNGSGKY